MPVSRYEAIQARQLVDCSRFVSDCTVPVTTGNPEPLSSESIPYKRYLFHYRIYQTATQTKTVKVPTVVARPSNQQSSSAKKSTASL